MNRDDDLNKFKSKKGKRIILFLSLSLGASAISIIVWQLISFFNDKVSKIKVQNDDTIESKKEDAIFISEESKLIRDEKPLDYGELKNQLIHIDYERQLNGSFDLTFRVKDKDKLIGLDIFNKELFVQGHLENLNFSQPSDLNLSFSKPASIQIFGNLINDPIVIDHNSNDYTFKIEDKNLIIGFSDLKKQLLNQKTSITDVNIENISDIEELTITNISDLENLKKKDESIIQYGNLLSKTNKIETDYINNEYIFQIGENTKIIGLSNFNAELDKQGDKETTPYIINTFILPDFNLLNFDTEDKTLAKAKAKKDSIETYGDLFAFDTSIKVDYNGTNYTFEIDEKDPIIGLDKLNIELNNQKNTKKINFLSVEDLQINSNLNFNNQEFSIKSAITKKIKFDSIEKYGNLFANEALIKVDYNGTYYTFQIDENTEIIGINHLNTQLNIQKSPENLNEFNFVEIDQLIERKAIFNFHNLKTLENAKLKKESLVEYGDLENSSTTIDYQDNQFTFQTEGKTKINGLQNYNNQFNLQNINSLEVININDLLTEKRFNWSDIAISIINFGNLKRDLFKINFKDDNFNFNTIEKENRFDFAELKKQWLIQFPEENSPIDIENLSDNFQLDESALIEIYGNLQNDLIQVSFENPNFIFQVSEKKEIIGINNFNAIFNDQKESDDVETVIKIKSLTNNYQLDKSALIEIYGDLKTDLIQVIFENPNFIFQVPGKKEIISLDIFNNYLKKQEINLTENNYSIEELLVNINELNFDTQDKSLNKAFNKKRKIFSIETYGNLETELIEIDFENGEYNFQIFSKLEITNIANFFIELINQSLLESKNHNHTINSLETILDNIHFSPIAFSIKTYGNLNREKINVDFENKNYTFQINEKLKILSLDSFNQELQNQNLTDENFSIENLIENELNLNFDIDKYSFQKAQKKAIKSFSIETYGDFNNSLINVDFLTDEGQYTFQIGEKEEIIGLENFNIEFSKQDLQNQKRNYIIRQFNNLLKLNLTEKAESVSKYENLQKQIIKTDYNGAKFTFQVGEQIKIIGLDLFNKELNKQGDTTLTDYTIEILNAPDFNKLNFDKTEYSLVKAILKKAKFNSIETYGDLNLNDIIVDHNGDNYTFQIGENTKIIGLDALNNELTNQNNGQILNYKISNLPLATNFSNFALSIKRFGNLKKDTIQVDYEGENYTFQINEKLKILNLDSFNQELQNQNLTDANFSIENLIENELQLNFDNTEKTLENAIAKKNKFISVSSFGNLKTETIEVDHNGTNFTFQALEQNKIISIDSFIQELKNQNIKAPENYKIKNLKQNFNLQFTPRAFSIKNYGDLQKDIIQVDYDGTNYNFQIEGKTEIGSLEIFNIELNNQDDDQPTPYTIKILSAPDFKKFNFDTSEHTFSKAIAKKVKADSIETYGNLKTEIIDVDYNNELFQFTVANKVQISSFKNLLEELVKQEINTDDLTIENIDDNLRVNFNEKATSIKTYGDLFSPNVQITFYYDEIERDHIFKILNKNRIIGFDSLNLELDNQSHLSNFNYSIENLNNNTFHLNFNDFHNSLIESNKQKVKFNSIENYGNLETETIIIDHDGNNYNFTINSNNSITGINLLAQELNNQRIIFPEELTIEYIKNNFNTDFTEYALSISNYGNLQKDIIQVDYNDENFTFQIENKDRIISLNNLILRLNEQNINENIIYQNDTISGVSNLNFDETEYTLEKAIQKKHKLASIRDYGDLNKEIINVIFKNHNFIFNINEKTEIVGLDNLNNELTKQNNGKLSNYQIEHLSNNFRLEFDNVALSVCKYGDLFDENSIINVDYENNQYTFKIANKKTINNLNNLNTELNIQNNNDNLILDYDIENLINGDLELIFDSQNSPQKAKDKKIKLNSIETYGNLETNDINIDFENNNYTFEIENKIQINSINDFVIELEKQGLNIPTSIKITNLENSYNFIYSSIANSIKTYGVLQNESIEVDYITPNYIFWVPEKQKIFNLINFQNQLNIQKIENFDEYSDINAFSNNPAGLNFVNLNKAKQKEIKAKSIETYGNLETKKINVTFLNHNYVFQIDEKIPINTLENFIIELNKQREIELPLDYELGALIGSFNFYLNDVVKSVRKFGDLLSIDSLIRVDYAYGHYIFQISPRRKINSLDSFNRELKIQKNDTGQELNYTIQDLIDGVSGLNFDTEDKTLAKAKAKKIKFDSIETYGDLKSQEIQVDWNGTNYIFQTDENTKIVSLSNLITELNKQGEIQFLLDAELNDLPDSLNFNFNNIARSIKKYGNLFADDTLIKVDYNGNKYTFQIGENTEIIGLSKLNTELDNQNDKEPTNYTIKKLKSTDFDLLNFDTEDKTLEKAKAKKNKYDSIETYGDLKLQEIEVNWNGTNYTFQIETKEKINNFNELNEELRKQNFISEEINIDNLKSKNLNWTLTEIVNSILEYGNFFSNDSTINVSFENENFNFWINEKTKMNNIDEFNEQIHIQKPIITENYTLQDLIDEDLGLIFANLSIAKQNKIIENSIEIYGDLEKTGINVDYNGTNYTFQIDDKLQILNLNSFNQELENQNLKTENEPFSLNDETELNFIFSDHALSVKEFGDLKNNTIKVDYQENVGFIFWIYPEKKIINLDAFNLELNNQNDQTMENYTIENLNNESTNLNFDPEDNSLENAIIKKEKINSINQYGNLIENVINVSYENDQYIFQIESNTEITGLNNLILELKKQNQEISFSVSFDDLIKTEILNFLLNNIAESVKTYGNLITNDISIDYDGDQYIFNIENKKSILGLINFNKELNIQNNRNDINYSYNDLATGVSGLSFQENNFSKISTKIKKFDSIKTYGDLTNFNNNILIDYDDEEYIFTISNKEPIIGLENLNIEIHTQNLNNNYTIDDLPYLNSEFSEVAYSVKTYGDLNQDIIQIEYEEGNYNFQIANKEKIFSLTSLNNELNKQNNYPDPAINYTIDDFINSDFSALHFDPLNKTLEKAVMNSEKILSLREFGTLNSDLVNINSLANQYIFQIDGKEEIIGLESLNKEFQKQNPDNIETITIDNLENFIYTDSIELINSIKTYGNFANEIIHIDFKIRSYTFQVDEKEKIFNLSDFNNILRQQNILEQDAEDYTIDDLANTDLHFGSENSFEEINTKKISIETYGDWFFNRRRADYNGSDFVFKIFPKEDIIGLKKLNLELNKQGDQVSKDYTMKDLENIFDNNYSISSYAQSVAIHGDILNEIIKVDYDGTHYTLQIGDKRSFNNIKAFNFELRKQRINEKYTTFGSLILDSDKYHFDITEDTFEKAKIKKERLTSIQEYGNLYEDRVFVDFDDGRFIFKTDLNTKITGTDNFISEFQKQHHGVELKTDALNFNWTKKANSVLIYGDLFSETAEINAEHSNGQYTFKIFEKKEISGLSALNDELDNQGDNGEEDYSILELKFLNFDEYFNLERLLIQAQSDSLNYYGDIKNINNISVNYENINNLEGREESSWRYTFKINLKTITGLLSFNQKLDKQGDQILQNYTIDDLINRKIVLNFDPQHTPQKAKNKALFIKSLQTFGNLSSDTIKVKYSNKLKRYIFQIDGKKKIKGLRLFIKILKRQKIIPLNINTIDDLKRITDLDGNVYNLNFDTVWSIDAAKIEAQNDNINIDLNDVNIDNVDNLIPTTDEAPSDETTSLTSLVANTNNLNTLDNNLVFGINFTLSFIFLFFIFLNLFKKSYLFRFLNSFFIKIKSIF